MCLIAGSAAPRCHRASARWRCASASSGAASTACCSHASACGQLPVSIAATPCARARDLLRLFPVRHHDGRTLRNPARSAAASPPTNSTRTNTHRALRSQRRDVVCDENPDAARSARKYWRAGRRIVERAANRNRQQSQWQPRRRLGAVAPDASVGRRIACHASIQFVKATRRESFVGSEKRCLVAVKTDCDSYARRRNGQFCGRFTSHQPLPPDAIQYSSRFGMPSAFTDATTTGVVLAGSRPPLNSPGHDADVALDFSAVNLSKLSPRYGDHARHGILHVSHHQGELAGARRFPPSVRSVGDG